MDPTAYVAICERLAKVETMIIELVRWREWMVIFWLTTMGGLTVSVIKLLLIDRRLKNNGGRGK